MRTAEEKLYITWEEVKKKGSKHYKTGHIEPIDLIKEGGMLQDFAIGNIIKYAFRNRRENGKPKRGDLEKIKHYCDMLLTMAE